MIILEVIHQRHDVRMIPHLSQDINLSGDIGHVAGAQRLLLDDLHCELSLAGFVNALSHLGKVAST